MKGTPRGKFRFLVALAALAALASMTAPPNARPALAEPGAEALLRAAMQRARDAGSYRVTAEVSQRVAPATPSDPILAPLQPPQRAETLAYVLEGAVRDAKHMRFALRDSRGTALRQLPPQDATIKEILIAGGASYARKGDAWVKEQDAFDAPGLSGDALLLLDVARDVREIAPAERAGGQFRRVAFNLISDDVVKHLLAQQGKLNAQTLQAAHMNGSRYEGAGEMWVDQAGYPSRVVLDLVLERGGADAFHATARTVADYAGFGDVLDAAWFDPALAPLSMQPTGPIPGVSLTHAQVVERALAAAGLAGAVALAAGLIRLATRNRRRVRPAQAVNLALIVALVMPNVARASLPESGAGRGADAAAGGSEVAQMFRDARAVAQKYRIGPFDAGSDPLSDQGDQDGDGLPNGYEVKLGTNPFARDTDLDGIDDKTEIEGKACQKPSSAVAYVTTDPINPDSNYDGINDGDEWLGARCWAGTGPNAWRDDNDGDGVPDAIDLSPFNASGDLAAKWVQEYPAAGYYVPQPGANFSFDPTGGSNALLGAVEPFYVEVQVRPTDAETLQYAYKDALYWPKGDAEGNIRNQSGMTTTGKLTLAPFLEVTVFEDHLPPAAARNEYGIGATKVISECPNNCDYKMIIPLAPVDRLGLTHAFQGKVYYLARNQTRIAWKDMRLKWAVRGNLGKPGPDNTVETGDFGIMIYDEGYRITGAQVQRQGGAQSLVAGALPTGAPESFDAGPTALLRAGLEARFLTGGINISDIQQRFNIGSSATITDRWGITFTYRVTSNVAFDHLDQMVMATNITLSRAVLNQAYPTKNVTPTLVIATEQRTATINIDEFESVDYADVSFNICGKDLITSRTLRLATYAWDPDADPNGGALARSSPFDAGSSKLASASSASGSLAVAAPLALGDWFLMGMEELLKWTEKNYDDIFSKDDPLYDAGLTVLKLIITNWHQGITAIQKSGNIDWQDIQDAITDPELYLKITQWLFDNGYLPGEIALVVNFVMGVWEAGGPVAWLEQQWNTFVTFVDGLGNILKGSVVGFSLNPVDLGEGGVNISLSDVMSFTKTAVNILNYFANILGAGVLAEIAKVLTKVLELLDKVRQVWNAVQAGLQALEKGIDAALKVIANELKSIAKPMGAIGLIFFVGFTLFNLWMTLSTGKGITQFLFVVLVLQAVWEIVKSVVLFVLASYFPIGTLIAAAITLINSLISMIGGTAGQVLQWIFDPIGALLNTLLQNPPPEQLTNVFGAPETSDLAFLRYADAPLGGIVENQRFGFALTGTLKMTGPSRGLAHSSAKMRLGRYAGGDPYQICGSALLQYLVDNPDQLSADAMVAAVSGGCQTYSFDNEYLWGYHSTTGKVKKSAQYFTDTLFINGVVLELPFDIRLRNFTNRAELQVTPYRPAINGAVALDVSYKITAWFENCGILGLDCDEYAESFDASPSGAYVYFDILPPWLSKFWNWDELTNTDVDGDGIPGNAQPDSGYDNIVCGGNSYQFADKDQDGLGDGFEFENDTDPCNPDTDGDGVKDGREWEVGTDPNLPDTDGDGLTDGQELPNWWDYDDDLTLGGLWRVDMAGAYGALPDPIAFPNPRQADFDRDFRDDSREKDNLTSPTAWNTLLQSELHIAQTLLNGGGTRVNVTTSPWPIDEASAVSGTLVISLPVAFSGLSASIAIITKTGSIPLDATSAVPGLPSNTYGWRLPPLWVGRQVSITLSGLPAIPVSPVSITANLAYSLANTSQLATSEALLVVNRGGPQVQAVLPVSGTLLGAGQHVIQGFASDPEGVSKVEVCITSSIVCGAFVPAIGTGVWKFNWTPGASGNYRILARGYDKYNVLGPTTSVNVVVDTAPPAAASFDLDSTQYLSTTRGPDGTPMITLTGRVTDTAGVGASGAGGAAIAIDGPISGVAGVPVANPGALASPFSLKWPFPMGSLGGAAPKAQGLYNLVVQGQDRAGNVGGPTDTLRLVVDDYAPLVVMNPPQTVASTTFTLTGKANDLAMWLRTQNGLPFTRGQTLADRDTRFALADANSRAVVVGDVNGDAIDDVALIEEDPTKRTIVGLFFGRHPGFSTSRVLSNADVTFYGEIGNTSGYERALAPSLGVAGDLNGDGVGDLVVGDPQIGDGKAYVVLGKRGWIGAGWQPTYTLASQADWVLTRTSTNQFGGSVAFGGDVDGDGLADLLVGAQRDTTVSTLNDMAYLYLGRERGVPPAKTAIRGFQCIIGGCLGTLPNLAGVGDTNGDGLDDFLVAISAGRVALIYGRPAQSWPAAATLVAAPSFANAWLIGGNPQQSVSFVGDVNGDGLSDMLIGDGDSNSTVYTWVYVVFGRRPETPFPTPPLTVSLPVSASASFWSVQINLGGRGSEPQIGHGLTPMGDLDRDGKADFAFGEHGNGSRRNGAAIVLGGAMPAMRDMRVHSATFYISGTANSQLSGYYLSSGDISGDGVQDLLIGAPGDSSAYLFEGALSAPIVSGIALVEVGVSGPITNPALPPTATLPSNWDPAVLRESVGRPVTAWRIETKAAGDGDYRVYARATDRAGNRLPAMSWYVGNTHVNTAAVAIPALAAGMNPAQFVDDKRVRVTISGVITSPVQVQALRTHDGDAWSRLQPRTGAISHTSGILHQDLRRYDLRIVARDAFGNVAHVTRTVTTDTLVIAPQLESNLVPGEWQTNISPTLVVTWPAIVDASGIVSRFAVIDTLSRTNPISVVTSNQITRLLNTAGVYYAHVRVVDGAGNQRLSHIGPFPVNRLLTHSAILPDGELEQDEYPLTTYLGYDPYSPDANAELYGTWDVATLWLAYPGANWSPGRRFAVFLDTRSGGLSATLGISEPVHTLPFAADVAVLIGGPTRTQVFSATGAVWTPITAPLSLARVDDATEIALRRSEIQATGAVSVLAYAFDATGVFAVLPAGARPTSTAAISGSVAFAGGGGVSPIAWPSLGAGAWPGLPSALTGQVLDPIISVNPAAAPVGATNVLTPGRQVSMTVRVTNPDNFPYLGVPMTVSLGNAGAPLMQFVTVTGALCNPSRCPAGGNVWVVTTTVNADASALISFTVRAITPSQTGVYSVPVTVRLAQHGLPGQVPASATSSYIVDYGVAKPAFANPGFGPNNTIFAKPGLVALPFLNDNRYTGQCRQTLQVNKGAGYTLLGELGAVGQVTGTLGAGQTQLWQLRAVGANGQLSPVVSRTVVADNVAPSAPGFAPQVVFTKTLALLRGTASDDNRVGAVEVSIAGRRFARALVDGGPVLMAAVAAPQASEAPAVSADWTLPIDLGDKDGEVVTMTARAVDAAGNAGPLSAVVTATLDTVGPAITVTLVGAQIAGTVSDGSGVALVQISFDGGLTYQPASLTGGAWSFNRAAWVGGPSLKFVLIRATDVQGNVSDVAVPDKRVVFLPHTAREDIAGW